MQINEVRYNASTGAFEARVDIHRDGTTFRYPCEYPAPVTMDIDRVRMGLMRQAKRMSDSGRNLHSHH